MSQFDSKFTKQTPVDSPDDSMLSESANKIFQVSGNIDQSHTIFIFVFLYFICLISVIVLTIFEIIVQYRAHTCHAILEK